MGLDAFRRDDSGHSPAFFSDGGPAVVTDEDLNDLVHIAENTRSSARICLFNDANSSLHVMIIAQVIGMDSKPRVLATKPKYFQPVRGRLALVQLDIEGVVTHRSLLSPGRQLAALVPPRTPYVDIPLDDVTVHVETTLGPHDRIADRRFPRFPWDSGTDARRVWRQAQISAVIEEDRAR